MTWRGPQLVLLVAGNYEPVPEALLALRVYLADTYGAIVRLEPSAGGTPGVFSLYVGPWPRTVPDEVWDLVQGAFFSLDWLDRVD